MKLKAYFESKNGTGVPATADKDGKVDEAIYSRPHILEDGAIAFIMRDRLTHRNLQSHPHAVYRPVERLMYIQSSPEPFVPAEITRREFLRHAGAVTLGLRPLMSALLHTPAGALPVTGPAYPDLKTLDDLMTSFLEKHVLPGASLAITRKKRLVYARGFGYADLEKREAARPFSLFRIASVSKPFTAAAVLKLAEQGKIRLHDRMLDYVKIQPPQEPGTVVDRRWNEMTVLHVLQHRGGWDRQITTDPVTIPWEIARSQGMNPPVRPEHVVRFMLGKPLDFNPGQRFAYANFGYLLLGRAIESVTGHSYESYVRDEILAPLGIQGMSLGRALRKDRAQDEVSYYDGKKRRGPALFGTEIGKEVPLPYGADNLESYDAHGGWIASASDLVRFSSCFDEPSRCPILSEKSIRVMRARPDGAAGYDADGRPHPVYYGCGWMVQPTGGGSMMNMWHSGLMAGTSSSLVHRWDTVNWAVLFNTDSTAGNQAPYALIDPLLHDAVAKIRSWPEIDLFKISSGI